MALNDPDLVVSSMSGHAYSVCLWTDGTERFSSVDCLSPTYSVCPPFGTTIWGATASRIVYRNTGILHSGNDLTLHSPSTKRNVRECGNMDGSDGC